MRRLAAVLLLAAALAACGTKVFTHTVTISIDDPDGRLGTPPLEVSLFDRQMGESEEWARRTIGTTAPGAPFTTPLRDTGTVMLGDTGPRPRVEGGLYVPAIEARGYFGLVLEAADGRTQRLSAPFVPFYGFPADAPKPPPLPIDATSVADPNGWRIALVLRPGR